MTPQALAPAAFAVLIAYGLFRRFRRLFGRQPVQPARMKLRIGLLALVGATLALRGLQHADVAAAAAAGLAGGVALALLGVKLTRFETTPQGRFYTPHGGIGVALSLLLVARLAYRFVVVYPLVQGAHEAGATDPFAAFQRSPLTSAMFALVVGYYIAYYAGVLLRSGAAAPPPG